MPPSLLRNGHAVVVAARGSVASEGRRSRTRPSVRHVIGCSEKSFERWAEDEHTSTMACTSDQRILRIPFPSRGRGQGNCDRSAGNRGAAHRKIATPSIYYAKGQCCFGMWSIVKVSRGESCPFPPPWQVSEQKERKITDTRPRICLYGTRWLNSGPILGVRSRVVSMRDCSGPPFLE